MGPENFTQRRDQQRLAVRIFLTGVVFMAMAIFDSDAMSPNVYGYEAYDIDAEFWAAGHMLFAGMVLYGIKVNGDRPHITPLARAFGWALLFVILLKLAASAWGAPDGRHLTLFIAIWVLFDCAFFAITNLIDWWRRK